MRAGDQGALLTALPALPPAQLGWPDMRLPIMYTMSFPERVPVSDKTWPRLDFTKANSLTFRAPDRCVIARVRGGCLTGAKRRLGCADACTRRAGGGASICPAC